MSNISETNAKGLLKAFQDMAKSTAFSQNSVSILLDSMIELAHAKYVHRRIYCAIKLYKSSVLTRWYWNYQLTKVNDKYLKFKESLKNE